MDGEKPKSRLDVSFCHETAGTKLLNSGNCIIYGNILQGKIILFNKIVNAGCPRFWKGQMKNCSKLLGVLFGDKANGGNLKILKRRGREGTHSTPFRDFVC